MIFLSLVGLVTADPIQLNLYYETLCGDCLGYMQDQVMPAYNDVELSALFTLNLFPYGNEQKEGSGYDCQHGPNECIGNLMEACVLNTDSVNDKTGTIFCMEDQFNGGNDPDTVLERCAPKGTLDTLQKCANGTDGQTYIAKIAAETPKHDYVPFVTVNGKHEPQAEDDLKTFLCSLVKGVDVPAACRTRPPSSTPTQAPTAGWPWPVWPSELEMLGASRGPFPFWCDTANSTKGAYKFLCLNRDTETRHKTRLLYSERLMSQINYREGCDLSHFGGESNVTCAHRWMPNGSAYVTYGDSKTGFCCQSIGHLPQSNPIPIPRKNFMNTCLRKEGPMFYNGTFYQGMIYNRTDVFAELPNYFFYYTAADDERPIAQGEGCVIDEARKGECNSDGKVSKLGPEFGDPVWQLFEYETTPFTWFANEELLNLPESCSTNLRECYNMECDSPHMLKFGAPDPKCVDPGFRSMPKAQAMMI